MTTKWAPDGDGMGEGGTNPAEGGATPANGTPASDDWKSNQDYAAHFRNTYHEDLHKRDEDEIVNYLHGVAQKRGQAFAAKLAQKLGVAAPRPQGNSGTQGQTPTVASTEAAKRYMAKTLGIAVEDLARLPQIFNDHKNFTQSTADKHEMDAISAACDKIPVGDDKTIKDGFEELTYARFARGDVTSYQQAATEAGAKFEAMKAAIIKEYENGKRGSRGLRAVTGGASTGGGQKVKPSLKDHGPGSDWSDFIPDAENATG